MSNQSWNDGQSYPPGGQGGFPQGGYQQGGYPQGGGYQQGGQGGYPPVGGYQQGGQGGYPPVGGNQQGGQGGQGGYPPGGGNQQGGSGGGGSKLPLIIVGAILLIGVIGVVIFFLTRGGGGTADKPSPSPTQAQPTPTEPSPEPTKPEPQPSETAPTPTVGATKPGKLPEITLDKVPAEVNGWKAANLADVFVYYEKPGTPGQITLLSMGDALDLDIWSIGLESKVDSSGGRVVCGITSGLPNCFVATKEFGVVLVGGSDSAIKLPEVAAIADGIAAKNA